MRVELFVDSHIRFNYKKLIKQDSECVKALEKEFTYTNQEYSTLLENCGYTGLRFYPSLIGKPDDQQNKLMVILAEKPVFEPTGDI